MVAISRRNLASRRNLTRVFLLTLYILLVLGPVVYLCASSFYQAFLGAFDWRGLIFPNARSALLLLKSIILAGVIALLCTIWGWLAAVWLWSKSHRWAWFWVWLAFSLAAIPPSLHAIIWFRLSEILRDWLGPGIVYGPLRGWLVVLVISIQAYLPFSFGCAYLGLRSIPPELIEAGRSARPDFKVLTRIALPLCKPALLVSGGMIFLMGLLDYSLPSLLQTNVYAMEIFLQYSASGSPEQAFLTTLPLLIVSLVVTVGLTLPVRSLVSREVVQQTAWTNNASWPGWLAKLLTATMSLMMLIVVALILTLLAMSGGPKAMIESVQLAGRESIYSLFTAGLSVLLCLMTGWLAAVILSTPVKAGWLAWGLIFLPLGIPATLVGAGLILLGNELPVDLGLLQNITPSLIYMARFTPVLSLILTAQFLRRDPLLREATLLFQANRLKRFLKVDLPLSAPALVLGAGMVFILSLSELPGTLMVVAPGQATLSMRIYNYLHYGATERVAGLCLVLVLCVLVIALLAGRYYHHSLSRSKQERPVE